MVGLANVDNTSDASKPVSTATQTALGLKANSANPTFTGTVSGITKDMVGLANVDNTSDANKPVSTAVQTALNAKANTTDLSGYMVKPWVSMRYVGGTVYNYGQASIQSVNTNTNSGDFDITFSPAHPNGTNYGVIAMTRNSGGAVNWTVSTSTSTNIRITTNNLTGTKAPFDFSLMTLQ
jgi:hypothetical protein